MPFRRRRLPYEAAPGVYALDAALGAWCYLATGAETLLVDTGIPGRAGAIERAIRRIGLDPAAVDRIVLTHFDVDHSGSARALSKRLAAPTAIHPDDVPYLAAPHQCPGSRRLLYRPWITRLLRWNRPRADQLLGHGETVGGWTVMHTPGHTPGSISLLRDDVAIVGDALVHRRGRLCLNSYGPNTDWRQHVASAKALAGTDAKVVLPGHYSPSTDPAALADLGRRLEEKSA